MRLLPESQKSDWVGIISSAVCIVHCLALPLALSFTGVTLAEEESFHWLDYFFVAAAALAVIYSVRRAKSRLIRFAFLLSWVFFAGSVLLGEMIPFTTQLMYAGSIMLIITHSLNLRQVRQGKVNHQARVPTKNTALA